MGGEDIEVIKMTKIRLLFILILECLIIYMFYPKMNTYIYIGESNHWIAKYKVNWEKVKINSKEQYEIKATRKLTLKYKGKLSELFSAKQLNYSLRRNNGGGRGKTNLKYLYNYKKFMLYKLGCTNSQSCSVGKSIEDKDEIVKLTISLDGNTEIIELKNSK
jgi:hypothetical protein